MNEELYGKDRDMLVSMAEYATVPGDAWAQYLYFIRCGDYVKVGITTNPFDRMKSLSAANPLPIEVLCMRMTDRAPIVEDAIHAHWKAYHVKCEWFRYDAARTQGMIHDLDNSPFAAAAIRKADDAEDKRRAARAARRKPERKSRIKPKLNRSALPWWHKDFSL